MKPLPTLSILLLGLGLAACQLAACQPETPRALGTLEWDRVTLPITAAEPILQINVEVGQQVASGAVLLQLDPAHAEARRRAAAAEVERLQQALAVVTAGARVENRREAAARVAEARALTVNAEQQLARRRALVAQKLLPKAELDQAEASAGAAQAALAAAIAGGQLLAHGNRVEDIAQAAAAVRSAQAQLATAEIDLDRLTVRAPRAGRIDALPYKVGDQPNVAAPAVILLVGAAPYARIYVPEPLRASVQPGQAVTVQVAGVARSFVGQVRNIRSEPSFTPYYALSGNDAARLSYLAEIDLKADAAELPAGLPLSVVWPAASRR